MTQIWKISDAAMKAVGAITPDQFDAKLVALLAVNAELAAKFGASETALKTANDSIATLTGRLDAADKLIAAQATSIEGLTAKLGKPETFTEARITEIATKAGEVAGSKSAVEAVAAVGAGAPPAPPSGTPGTAKSGAEALNAAGKFEEAWAADKNIQAEFPNAKGYAAFMRAQGKGQVRVANR